MTLYRRLPVRATAAAALAVAGLGLAGCAAQDPEPPAEAGSEELLSEEPVEPYSGPYGEEFAAVQDEYTGEEVVLVAEVAEVVSPVAFTVAGDDGSAVPPLLVVHDPESAAAGAGTTVEVTGTLRAAYNVPSVEEEAGLEAEAALAEYDGQPFVEATAVEVVAAGEASPTA